MIDFLNLYKNNTKHNNKVSCGGLISGTNSLILNELSTKSKKPLLIITKDIASENRLLNEIKFYNPDIEILNFANYEVLAYDSASPHSDIISNRIMVLNKLQNIDKNQQFIIITTLESTIFRLTTKDFINSNSFVLNKGDVLEIEAFTQKLIASGYFRVNKVVSSGEFSVKGSIIDIFVIGQNNGVRIDLFDNEIEEIRTFDTKTQRSIAKIDNLTIIPAKEFNFDKPSRKLFLTQHLAKFNNQDDTIYQSVANNIIPSGIEFYLPLFFQTTNSLFDYLPKETIICFESGLSETVDGLLININQAYTQAMQNIDYKPLAVADVFLEKPEFFSKLNAFNQFKWQSNKHKQFNINIKLLPVVKVQDKSLALLEEFLQKTNKNSKQKILICVSSNSRLSILLETLEAPIQHINTFNDFIQSSKKIHIIVGTIIDGFISDKIIIITEKNIFNTNLTTQKRRKRAKHKDFDEAIQSLLEISENDAIVHENYGVGRYLGLRTQKFDDILNDFIEIEYANNSKLLIPIDEIGLISRYSGGIIDPPLHKLGSQIWNKAKKKALDAMRDVASELLKIYAQREMVSGFAINPPSSEYDRFVDGFEFEETPDQVSASEDILQDMQSDKPMDRLICGDVGFGKTEIAMRAAFLAVENKTQVAILVPTTLLANQHYKSFILRFDGFAINIAVISRFQSAKEQTQIKKNLKNGVLDIVIGTHKLIHGTMEYKNLGLVIIDEEHRFGVSQKEKLKEIRLKCNILTMSATPIPRTLNLALGSLRKMSIIATPPKGKVSVQTFVSEFSAIKIKDAISRELHRGGQVFFLHNDIDSIDNMAEMLEKLLPNLKIRIAHGQMPSTELEAIMRDFYHGKFQILVCTTIIETGIDIANANTIIINNANNFGLSQLHQLRGRVGRSHHKAYAYLLVKSFKNLNENAKKRLDAIESLEELGAGFMLANHDLEIRGAGDILGKNQSGKISEIGFNLYYDLLDRTVKSLKNNQKINLKHKKIAIDLGVSCIIPQDYMFDVHTRLEFYQKIDKANNKAEQKDIQIEMIDRFGLLPDSCKNLFMKKSLEILAEKIEVEGINAFSERVLIKFGQNAKIDFAKIIKLIQLQSKIYKLKNQTTLIYLYEDLEDIDRIKAIIKLLKELEI